MRVEEDITYGVFGFDEWIIDSNNVNISVENGIAEDDTANTTKAMKRFSIVPQQQG